MPNLAEFHPQIVHFVVAGAGLGIFFRWVSLTGKLKWTDQAATALIVIGAVAGWFAASSGIAAHGVAERIPGAVHAVQEHEEAGLALRTGLIVLAVIELVLLVPAVAKWRKAGLIVSSLVGVWGVAGIYYAGHEGGELVYSYAGGVGTRSGDTTDVNNLVKAALYNRAALSRTQKNEAGAAAGFAELAAKFPEDQTIQIMGAESLVIDTKDYAGALTALAKIPQPADTARTYRRYLLAKVDAYIGAGKKDSAKAILEPLVAKAPNNKALQTRMEKLK
jgi:uncharacterized membrane protein